MRLPLVSSLISLLICAADVAAAVPNHSVEMAPPAAGTYPVACTDLAHDAARLAQLGGSVDDYWGGANDRYVTDILADPADTLKARPRVPNTDLYPGRHDTVVDFVVIACYPTDAANTRPDYVLPNGQVIPRMQRANQPPILPAMACLPGTPSGSACGRWPLLVFSHGLASSPVDTKSVDFLVRLASYGYIVAAPFHGDARFSRVHIEDFNDLVYIARDFDRITEMQAMRPLAVKAVIDLMLSGPQFSTYVDASRIGGIGGSMGGATMTWLLGAELTSGVAPLRSRPTVQDPRIKAAVGYVPYAGQRLLPAFGDDNASTRNVTAPYLAISGTADTTAPMFMMEQAVNNFRGARYHVGLQGVPHTYDPAYADDVFGWVLPFFSAYLNGDKSALDGLTRQKNVRGDLNDFLRIDYTAPTPLQDGELLVEEFYNTITRHYYLIAKQSDKDLIDRGLAGPGNSRTGFQFKGYVLPGVAEVRPPLQAPVCRFFIQGLNTHFFSTEQADCDYVRSIGGQYEGIEFWIDRARPVAACPAGTHAVTRLYNNRWRENDSSHRYTTSNSVVEAMKAQGWLDEGAVMCAPL